MYIGKVLDKFDVGIQQPSFSVLILDISLNTYYSEQSIVSKLSRVTSSSAKVHASSQRIMIIMDL